MDNRSYQEIVQQLTNLSESKNFTVKELTASLMFSHETNFFTQNPQLIKHLNDVFDIVLSDMDGDGKLTAMDLKMTLEQVGDDIQSVFTDFTNVMMAPNNKIGLRLIKSLALVIYELPGSLSFSNEHLEIVYLKLFIWAMAIHIPRKNGIELNSTILGMLVKLLLFIFQKYQSLQVIKQATDEINDVINKTFSWLCCCKSNQNARVKMDAFGKTVRKLSNVVTATKIEMQKDKQIKELADKVNELSNK